MAPKVEVVEIGPAEARRLLDANERNRAMNYSLVNTYARLMSADKWPFVGDPIRVSVTGVLLDGQKRMAAIEKCGKTLQFVLITGLPDETQAYMDIGQKRSPGDVFAINQIPNAVTTAAVTANVMRYDMGRVLDTKYTIEPGELLEYYQDEANTDLIDRATVVAMRVKRMLPLSPAVVGAVHVLASRVADAFAVNEFFEKLELGYDMTRTDPINALRNTAIRRDREDLRTHRGEWFYLVVRAWNAYAIGEELERLQLPRNGLQSSDQIPAVVSVREREPEPVSEDNPAVTPYSLTRREREARAS